MKRKISKLFIIIILLLSYSGCNKCDKNILEEINIEYWKDHTLSFLDKKSNFSAYNYHHNNKYPWIVVDGFGNNTIEDEIVKMLNFRAILINELIKTHQIISCKLDIREVYNYSRIVYIIRDDKGNIYFVRMYGVDGSIKESYLVTDTSQKINFDSWFDDVPVFERKYFFSFENGFFRTLNMYSKLYYVNDSLIIEYPYAIMSD